MAYIQTLSDGKTVWINDDEGTCLGRFSKFGIDVHKSARHQAGGSHCLECKLGPTTAADWELFTKAMDRYHKVTVKNDVMPGFIRDEFRRNRLRSKKSVP